MTVIQLLSRVNNLMQYAENLLPVILNQAYTEASMDPRHVEITFPWPSYLMLT